jgi:hypothetical protein
MQCVLDRKKLVDQRRRFVGALHRYVVIAALPGRKSSW